jgi:aspartyl-tRNA(Asn)/glutamyl-tRNA(Gln) amidotransferase subunit B
MISAGAPAKPAANWLMGEMSRALNDAGLSLATSPVSAASLAGLIDLIERRVINSSTAKEVFEKMWTSGAAATDIVAADGLGQISDEAALAAAVDQVLTAHPEPARQYRAGQTKVLGFLVGQVMKATGGKASPALVNELMRRALDRG